MLKNNRRDFLKLLAASGLSLAMPSPVIAGDETLLLKPIPSSGEKLPVIGLGTSRVFEVGPGDFEREGPKEVLRTLANVPNSMM
ncbi:MAG: twin-arginine translocation signal domain-containing protein, partial [Chromatiales bacterium]